MERQKKKRIDATAEEAKTNLKDLMTACAPPLPDARRAPYLARALASSVIAKRVVVPGW